jgi:ABC-type bacteriocin/lantibiotic exporter with double-glycine peptidase domain
LNIDIKAGELIGVVGLIGSGKSTLLHAFMEEIPYTTGSLRFNGNNL